MRLIAWGWALGLGLALAAAAFADEVAGHFGGGPVHVRPWMQGYNLAINLCQLLSLALLIAGALGLPPGRARRVAWLSLALAASLVLAMLLFPLWWGGGPWAPDAPQVKALRVLVFAPSLLRTLGLAAAATALYGWNRVLLSLLFLDAALVAWKWAATPRAVMAFVHPFSAEPLGLLPWAAATAIFFWLSRRTARTRY
jgi:hypothetical protein